MTMPDGTVNDPVFVVVPTGEVDEHQPPPSARVRLPHALPVEGERGPDRPAVRAREGISRNSSNICDGGNFKSHLCRTPALLARIPVTKTSSIHKWCLESSENLSSSIWNNAKISNSRIILK